MIFHGEKITLPSGLQSTSTLTDEEINEKYISGEVRIVTEQARYPLNTVSKQIVHNKNYILDPEFQRRHRWDNKRRSALIESLIMNVPIPPIFLYEFEYSNYEVMDGLQRLTAIAKFYDDEYALEGLTQWKELNGRKYSTLPDKIQKGIDRRYISSIILLNETAKTKSEADFMKKMVFDRINSGGELLSPQEKRNANYNGDFNRLCIKLSSNNFLCELWSIPQAKFDSDGKELDSIERTENPLFRNMSDVELVLRFFAYRQRKDLQKGLTLEKYLDLYLEHANSFDLNLRKNLEYVFNETIKLASDLFGESAFWMYRCRKGSKWAWFERPTTSIYDPMMHSLSNLLSVKDQMIDKKDCISRDIEDFYTKNYESFEGRNTNPTTLDYRDSLFNDFFSAYYD